MKTKKNEKANLEKNRFTFMLVGLALTLTLVYTAMEWTSAQGTVIAMEQTALIAEDEYIPISTNQTPPPPPPPPKQKVADFIEIFDNDEDIDEDMIVEEEITEDTEVEVEEIEETEEEEVEDQPFVIVEQMPEFPGGVKKLMKFISKNIKYPNVARENGIEGRVFLRFVITKDGDVDRLTVVRGVDPLLDNEAMRVAKKMKGWKPGMQRGKPVPVWYTLPIAFTLR